MLSDRQMHEMSKQNCLLLIQIAKQTKRVDDMIGYCKILANKDKLSIREIAAVDSGFKLKTQLCIQALKKLQIRQSQQQYNKNKLNNHILVNQILKCKNDLFETCVDAINVFNVAKGTQSKTIFQTAFYKKSAGDYNRMIAQYKTTKQDKKKFYDQAQRCYNKTLSLLQQQSMYPKPIKLGALINSSIIQYVQNESLQRALYLAFQAEYQMYDYDLDEVPQLKTACKNLMDINNRNLALWSWNFGKQYSQFKGKFDQEKQQIARERAAKQAMLGIANIFSGGFHAQPAATHKRQPTQEDLSMLQSDYYQRESSQN